MEEEASTQGRQMDQQRANLLDPTRTWEQAEGGKGGRKDAGHGERSDTQRGEHRQAAEAGRWRGWTKSRWMTYHYGIGGGERVYRE